ncbi:CYTH and CHAD domain-containing protein [Accumulibacter sp.]|uniref:CYTH and CHAD domain-containing protein n=1 Tax=Accumulibacter sp. TaxID=2053492 RepID=UPI0025DDC0CB|nr:CYTH and CHAD domain-containing protein [Accumulibacter sp.]MCM8595448.1 CHAD domain-containing protein [Accumulibacter sp.]MCM8626371.1 CHAD domain-containing protein [Accumulibacter sp.]MDS4049595.1 CHAD domain-containing protein [Accumulibacter sp.]
MALETEIKLTLPAGAARRVPTHRLLAGSKALRQKLVSTYYDTPDRRLQRKRLAVRYRQIGEEWLLTIKNEASAPGGLAQRREWEEPGTPGEFDFSVVDSPKLRRFLEEAMPSLAPVFVTDFTRSLWTLTPQEGTRIEVALDRGKIVAGQRSEAICELELELREGQVADLFTTALALQADLPLHPETSSKAERGYLLASDAGLQPARAGNVPLQAGMTSVGVFRTTVFSCLAQLQGNERGVRDSDAPEFIHQARVAIRRLRSAIRLWRPLLPEDYVGNFDPRWRDVANAMGDTRNWDVFITEILPPIVKAFPEHADVQKLAVQARNHLASCRKQAQAALTAPTYSQLLLEFTGATVGLAESKKPPLAAFVPRSLNKRAKRVAALAIETRDSNPEARHALRVALKRLRYALEFFAPLFPARRMQRYHQSAAGLLDLLGRMNDMAVAEQLVVQALPGHHSDLVRAWLAGRTDLMLGQLEGLLREFLDHQPPWEAG